MSEILNPAPDNAIKVHNAELNRMTNHADSAMSISKPHSSTSPVGRSTPPDSAPAAKLSKWDSLTFTGAHAFSAAVLACFGIRGLHSLGRALGTAEWCVNYKRRRRFVRTLVQVLQHKPSSRERRRWSRDYFVRSRCDKLFYLAFDRIPRDAAMELFSISDQPLLDRSLSRGRGVYMAMSHHGPHHLAAMLMALYGYRVAGVRDRREGASRRYVQSRFDRRYPEFQRMRVLFADDYPRDIYRCLREGYILGSAMDVRRTRHTRQRTEKVTIFGEQREFLTGPLRIALRCGTPVLQAFVVPDTGLRYRLEIVATLLDPELVEDEDTAVAAALETYCRNVERYVRAHPSLITRT